MLVQYYSIDRFLHRRQFDKLYLKDIPTNNVKSMLPLLTTMSVVKDSWWQPTVCSVQGNMGHLYRTGTFYHFSQYICASCWCILSKYEGIELQERRAIVQRVYWDQLPGWQLLAESGVWISLDQADIVSSLVQNYIIFIDKPKVISKTVV